MKKYELMLVLPGTLDEKEAETRSNEILGMVKENDPEAEIRPMGKMRLAYPIKQIRYGYFYTIIFSVEPSIAPVLQDKLRLTRDLLRAMVTEYNPKYTPTQKLTYSTNSAGVTVMNEGPKETEAQKEPEAKVTMQDINKKLDEILSGDIIPGV
jgi:ribosomal protein S6